MKLYQSIGVLFLFLLNTTLVKGQGKELVAEENKTLLLNASQLLDNQTIQWQESTNNVDWNDITEATSKKFTVTLNNLPKYYRSKLSMDECNEIFFSEVISVFKKHSSATLYWSDPKTWGTKGKPQAGDNVTIPMGKHIILDETPPALGKLMIMGSLEFDRKDLSLTAENIMVHSGEFIIGSERQLFTHKAIVTLTDSDINAENTRGIMVMAGGKLELHGASPNQTWTKINAHAEDGATKITLKESVPWKIGDEIVVGPTDFYEAANGKSITQKVALTAVNKNLIDLDKPLEAFHWGLLQYATTNGMSLTEENIVPTPAGDFLYGLKPNNPKILDQRAPVGNLTRNIVIQSPDDDAWNNEGFGVHIMIMRESEAHLNGVEIKRGGQRAKLGRYPFHWHMLSYNGSENLGDATGQYIKNSAINISTNRGIVVHGTNGTLIQNNVIYDVKGHAIFTEDASERRNTFDHNLILKVRNPEKEFALKIHELSAFRRGSSGFWISTPDNTTTNNHVADCEGNGFWLAFPMRPFGESSGALYDDGKILDPRKMPFGVFEYNTAHSCNTNAFHNDDPELDEAGNTGAARSTPTMNYANYTSDSTGRPSANSGFDRTTWQRFTIKSFSGWKCNQTMWGRANYVNALESIAADNHDTFFAGAGVRGLIIGSLAIGRSLNYNYNDSKYNDDAVPNGFASYHHTFDIQGNIAINFPPTQGVASGAFGITDYYLRPVEKGHWLSEGNILINSHPGVRITASEAWRANRVDPIRPHFNLSGAVWDPHGMWGPANNYVVPNDPFYIYGSTTTTILPSADISGGVSIPGPFYGFDDTNIYAENGSSINRTTMKYTRYDNDLNKVGGFTLYHNSSNLLPHMKDMAARKGGIFEVEYPDLDDVYDIQINSVSNFLSTADELIIAYEFTGTKDAQVSAYDRRFTLEKNLEPRVYQKVNSFEAVKNSSTESFWQDKTNHKVWMKIKGGVFEKTINNEQWENHIYQNMYIRIWEKD